MKVLVINVVLGYGSTGKAAWMAAKEWEKQGNDVRIAYSRDPIPEECRKYAVKIGDKADTYAHAAYTRVTDKHGLASKIATEKFLKWADEYNPDLVWLHNIHGYYINYEMLFAWIKARPEMQVKWTLHDCWAYTGHCAYYSYAKCYKWKEQCKDCPQSKEYPKSIADNSADNYNRKKTAFTGVKNLTITVPSKWMAGEVKKSFLKEYPVEVVYNRINTSIFKPTKSNFKEKYGIADKKMLLGVANTWERRKGTADMAYLAKKLGDDWMIVLVGKKDSTTYPKNVIQIDRTNSQAELAEIYSAADIYVNTSREETMGLTTVEAMACGTPVIVYNETAIPEVVDGGGIVVEADVKNIIENLDKAMEIPSEKCIENAGKYS